MNIIDIPLSPIWVTLKLALVSTLLLLVIGGYLAWWLNATQKRWKVIVEILVTLPLVLPPTVIGFYLLLLLSPTSFIGKNWSLISATPLVFSFNGLVIGSVIYSLPFVVRPLSNGFAQIDTALLRTASSLGASPLYSFLHVIVPLTRQSILTATVLGFAHTVGEFGVVLMIGGNIPNVTQVLATTIYDQVESGHYLQAHIYSAGLLLFSCIILWFIYGSNSRIDVIEQKNFAKNTQR